MTDHQPKAVTAWPWAEQPGALRLPCRLCTVEASLWMGPLRSTPCCQFEGGPIEDQGYWAPGLGTGGGPVLWENMRRETPALWANRNTAPSRFSHGKEGLCAWALLPK